METSLVPPQFKLDPNAFFLLNRESDPSKYTLL
jgi:hypothetical protein